MIQDNPGHHQWCHSCPFPAGWCSEISTNRWFSISISWRQSALAFGEFPWTLEILEGFVSKKRAPIVIHPIVHRNFSSYKMLFFWLSFSEPFCRGSPTDQWLEIVAALGRSLELQMQHWWIMVSPQHMRFIRVYIYRHTFTYIIIHVYTDSLVYIWLDRIG